MRSLLDELERLPGTDEQGLACQLVEELASLGSRCFEMAEDIARMDPHECCPLIDAMTSA